MCTVCVRFFCRSRYCTLIETMLEKINWASVRDQTWCGWYQPRFSIRTHLRVFFCLSYFSTETTVREVLLVKFRMYTWAWYCALFASFQLIRRDAEGPILSRERSTRLLQISRVIHHVTYVRYVGRKKRYGFPRQSCCSSFTEWGMKVNVYHTFV